jgi:hypothetical protein
MVYPQIYSTDLNDSTIALSGAIRTDERIRMKENEQFSFSWRRVSFRFPGCSHSLVLLPQLQGRTGRCWTAFLGEGFYYDRKRTREPYFLLYSIVHNYNRGNLRFENSYSSIWLFEGGIGANV